MTSQQATAEQLGFDPEALRAKYRAERDKRLRETRFDTVQASIIRLEIPEA